MLYCVIAASAISTIVGHVANKLILKQFTLLDVGLTSITALCNQDCIYQDSLISLRITKMSSYILAGVIVPAFSAFAISFLTIEKTKIPFTDFEAFVKDGTYKLASFEVLPVTTFYFEV